MSVDLIFTTNILCFSPSRFRQLVNGGKHDHHSSLSVKLDDLIDHLNSLPGLEPAPEEKTANTKIWSLTCLMTRSREGHFLLIFQEIPNREKSTSLKKRNEDCWLRKKR